MDACDTTKALDAPMETTFEAPTDEPPPSTDVPMPNDDAAVEAETASKEDKNKIIAGGWRHAPPRVRRAPRHGRRAMGAVPLAPRHARRAKSTGAGYKQHKLQTDW